VRKQELGTRVRGKQASCALVWNPLATGSTPLQDSWGLGIRDWYCDTNHCACRSSGRFRWTNTRAFSSATV